MATTIISVESTQFITAPVFGPQDPTGASVSFAFIGPYATTTQAADNGPTATTTFIAGSWQADTGSAPWTAQILVGPSGSVTLATGAYQVWVKVSSPPETPVVWAGPLVVM